MDKVTGGASATPLMVLFGLNLVDELDRLAFATFTPEVRDAFGLSDTGIVAISSLTASFLLLAAVPIGMLGDRFERVKIVTGAALVWASMSVLTGLSRGVAMLMAVRLLAGIGRLANEIVHPSLLTDYYDAKVQPKVFAVHRLANSISGIFAVVAAVLALLVTWRAVFIIFAVPTLLLIGASSKLQEPPRGTPRGALSGSFRTPRPKRGLVRLWHIRTLRWQWIALFLLGLAIVAIPTFITLFLERVHGAGVLSRGFEKWLSGVGSTIGLGISGYFSSRATRHGRPDHLARIVAISAGSFALSLVAMALAPSLTMAIALSFAVAVGGAAFQPAYYPLVGMVTPPELKTVTFGWGVMFIAVGAVGGVGIAAIGENQGYRVAFIMLAGIILLAAAASWYSARFVLADVHQNEQDDDGGDRPRGGASGDDSGAGGGGKRETRSAATGPAGNGKGKVGQRGKRVATPSLAAVEFVPPERSASLRVAYNSLGLAPQTSGPTGPEHREHPGHSDLLADVSGRSTWTVGLLAAVGFLPVAMVALSAPWLLVQLHATPKLLTGAFCVLALGTLWGALSAPRIFAGGRGAHLHLISGQIVGLGLLIAGSGRLLPGLFVAGMGAGALQGANRLRAAEALDPADRGKALSLAQTAALAAGAAAGLLVGLLRLLNRTPSLALGIAGVLALVAVAVAAHVAPASFAHEDETALGAKDRLASRSTVTLMGVWRKLGATRSGLSLVVVACTASAAAALLMAQVVPLAQQQWGSSSGAASCWIAVAFTGAAIVLHRESARGGLDADVLPQQWLRLGRWLIVSGLAVVVASFWKDLSALPVLIVGLGCVLLVPPLVDMGVVLTVAPSQRITAVRILTAVSAAASLVALQLGTILQTRVQVSLGVALAGVLVAMAGGRLQRGSHDLLADTERMVDGVVAAAALQEHLAAGGTAPLLQCRQIEFAYGRVQVLHGVDFTVREGEIVALLGTNGAGKSTLLRVISGLGLPLGGSVLLSGEDITTTDSVERVTRGVVQVPGGKATFGELSVEDNLRSHAFTCGRGRGEVGRAIDEAMTAFPRLRERRTQLASTLSGGERQMLALTKALMLKPKILLIDELSLGLAPAVVGELLETVREINRRGTAIVLVEQSVNVALSIADRAYYMDKGRVSFEGESRELLAEPDLLRSAYLFGAAQGLDAAAVGSRA